MLRRALEIHEQLGQLEGAATSYGNIGMVLRERGDLDQAETMVRKALEIEERFGRFEGVAISCFNLGLISWDRGDVPAAKAWWERALELFVRTGAKLMARRVGYFINRILSENPGGPTSGSGNGGSHTGA
jgi:tetratricopeptide (TPR) repeat protein